MMRISDLIAKNKGFISFEFFPPKEREKWPGFFGVVDRLARFDKDLSLPEVDRTVHVANAREFFQALSPGVRIVIDTEELDLTEAGRPTGPHLRWESLDGVAWPVLHGLDRVIIQGADECVLRSPAKGAPALSLEDCGLLALDNIRLEGIPDEKGPPVLTAVRTSELRLRDVRIFGGVLGLSKTGTVTGLNLLVEGSESGAILAKEVERLSLDNLVLRENKGVAIISLEQVKAMQVRQALIRNNEAKGSDAALVKASKSGKLAISDSYLLRNDFKVLAIPASGLELKDCTKKKNGF